LTVTTLRGQGYLKVKVEGSFQFFCPSKHVNKKNYDKQAVQRTAISPAVVFCLEHFVFLSTWLVRWTWPKLYTTTGQEWE